MVANENILLHLRQRLPGCSPTLQKLGNFILAYPQRVLHLTSTELVKETGTSEASVTRFCNHLNCKGYAELKMALVFDLQQQRPGTPNGGDSID